MGTVVNLNCTEAQVSATPFGHRTRLGSTFPPGRQQAPGSARATMTNAPVTSHSQTPSQRRPMLNMNNTTANRLSVSGYGMSAGLKIGRQQGTQKPREAIIPMRINAYRILEVLISIRTVVVLSITLMATCLVIRCRDIVTREVCTDQGRSPRMADLAVRSSTYFLLPS